MSQRPSSSTSKQGHHHHHHPHAGPCNHDHGHGHQHAPTPQAGHQQGHGQGHHHHPHDGPCNHDHGHGHGHQHQHQHPQAQGHHHHPHAGPCNHDHGHGHQHGHKHGHGHGHHHPHDGPCNHDHGHGHQHGHSHQHGHGHGHHHPHDGPCNHDHGHGHGHEHKPVDFRQLFPFPIHPSLLVPPTQRAPNPFAVEEAPKLVEVSDSEAQGLADAPEAAQESVLDAPRIDASVWVAPDRAGQPEAESIVRVREYLNKVVRVQLRDGRILSGPLACFDRQRNLLLSDAQEETVIAGTQKGESRDPPRSYMRSLGYIVVPWAHVENVHVQVS